MSEKSLTFCGRGCFYYNKLALKLRLVKKVISAIKLNTTIGRKRVFEAVYIKQYM